MKRRITRFGLFIVLLVSLSGYSYGQYSFSYFKLSKLSREEVVAGFGVSNFLGDLGGRNKIGTSNSPVDLEFSSTRPAIVIAYRYRFKKWIALKSGFNYAVLNGDDSKTLEEYRNYRNLHFRSSIFELASQAELFINKMQQGQRYLKSVRGFRNIDYNLYFFAGIGVFYFNPKAQYKGKWYELQPLGTEGQGIKEGTKKYNRVSIAIPIGMGFQYGLNNRLSIGIEYGYRKTFTDYIDDVSTNYYNKEEIAVKRGEIAAALSDPSNGENPNWTLAGEKRGNPNGKDGYMISTISINYKLNRKKISSRVKSRSKF